ncbi:MAG: C40 family peptidase [Bacteroidales bacterium]|jgi:hypothetical protein|nr:C40 family peptidase [Bacteroidales bacterium]
MSIYGFCNLSVIPLREMPSDLSQMNSQLLFGDMFKVLDKTENWIQIQNVYDDYIGWIDEKQQITINLEEFNKLKTNLYTNNKSGTIISNNELYSILPASSFPSNINFNVGSNRFETNMHLRPFSFNRFNEISQLAQSYLNTPYLWGGKTPFGIDCSGFTQSVYKIAGIKLKRDAWQQAKQGQTLSFLSEAKSGDLLFFDNADEKINHVGILLESNKIIHASGKVRIDLIDHQGIYNKETKYYSHNLRLIKTFSA